MRLTLIARGRRNESALTLVEVLIATAILATSYISLYAAMTFGWSTARESRQNLRASEIMEEKMEQIRLYNWQEITNTATFMNPAPIMQYYNPSNTDMDPIYWCKVSVTNVPSTFPASYQSNMRLVTVSVVWTNFYGSSSLIQHSRTNQTYVARYGMQSYVIDSGS